MRYGLSILELIQAQDPSWISKTLPLQTEDSDAIEIDALLIKGHSPDEAAYTLQKTGIPVRRLYGLKYLARERENAIMEAIGDTISELAERVQEGERVKVHPRRMRRLVSELEKRGINTEVLYIVRRID
jgi:hypothetical protein